MSVVAPDRHVAVGRTPRACGSSLVFPDADRRSWRRCLMKSPRVRDVHHAVVDERRGLLLAGAAPMPRVHIIFSFDTLLRLIWFSGLKPWLSSVRRHVSQFAGSRLPQHLVGHRHERLLRRCVCAATLRPAIGETEGKRTGCRSASWRFLLKRGRGSFFDDRLWIGAHCSGCRRERE